MKGIAAVLSSLMLIAVWIPGCTNVSQMQKRYLAGDTTQLDRLAELVVQPDYPYATRRKAARVLGELGDRRAVPVLIAVLGEYGQRTTLKEEAVLALGRLGDPAAVEPIGRMLDLQLESSGNEVRVAALQVLGQLGGPRAAEILINAMSYYSLLMSRQEQVAYRGIFSGEENAYQPYRTPADSSGGKTHGPQMGVGVGGIAETGTLPPSFFGVADSPPEAYDPTPDERRLAHAALVRIGPSAVPVLTSYVGRRETSLSLRQELLAIVQEISGTPAVGDSGAASGGVPDSTGAVALPPIEPASVVPPASR